MIVLGGIYTFENMIKIVIDVENDTIITYDLVPNETISKKEIIDLLFLEYKTEFNKYCIHQYFEPSFLDTYNGYLGEIDLVLLQSLQMFHLWHLDD